MPCTCDEFLSSNDNIVAQHCSSTVSTALYQQVTSRTPPPPTHNRQGELTRCITALLSIFPSSSPFPRSGRAKGGDANGPAAGGGDKKGADDGDHPPELTHRSISCGSDGRRPVSSRGIAAVDLEWVGSLAEEFNVVLEGVVAEGDDGDAGKGGGGGGGEEGGEEGGAGKQRGMRRQRRATAVGTFFCVR